MQFFIPVVSVFVGVAVSHLVKECRRNYLTFKRSQAVVEKKCTAIVADFQTRIDNLYKKIENDIDNAKFTDTGHGRYATYRTFYNNNDNYEDEDTDIMPKGLKSKLVEVKTNLDKECKKDQKDGPIFRNRTIGENPAQNKIGLVSYSLQAQTEPNFIMKKIFDYGKKSEDLVDFQVVEEKN